MNIRYPTDPEKLAFGSAFGLIFVALCLVLSFFVKESWALQVALCLCGAAGGWLTGILVSPSDDEEKKTFSDLAKGFLAFGSGFVVAKFDKVIVDEVSGMIRLDPSLLVARVALFATCFLVGLLFTIVYRLYGTDPEQRKKDKVARLEREAKRANARLSEAREER